MGNNNSDLIRAKRNQQSSYRAARRQKQESYNANVRKLERLRRVKAVLERNKGNASDRHNGLKNYGGTLVSVTDFVGTNANDMQSSVNVNIVNLYNTFVKDIDSCLDAICDQITRLENENMRLNGDILRLGSLINSLANEIEKLFN